MDHTLASDSAPDASPSPDQPDGRGASPFQRVDLPLDRRLGLAVRVLGVAVAAMAAFLAWSYFSAQATMSSQSPSARAVANLSALVEQSPRDTERRVSLAEALAADGQLDAAIAQLKAVLTIDKENAAALLDLALIAMEQRDWATAQSYLKHLVTTLSKNEMSGQDQRLADVYYYLGTTYVETSRYEDAVANLKKSLTIRRDSSPAHYMLSVAYARLDLPEMQAEELRIVIAFDPKEAQANYDLGMLALKDGDKAQAAEYFRISADNAPAGITKPQEELAKLGSASEHLSAANTLKTRDVKKALAEARIAAALDPKSREAILLVANLSEETGDKARALNAWQHYLDLVPGDPDATDAIKRLSAQ